MSRDFVFLLTFISALGAGVAAGVFFAFSTFVMKALTQLPPAQGITAMQSINMAVVTSSFMVLLFGTGAACILLAIHAAYAWADPGVVYLLAGSVLYVGGTILVTIAFNVPRNNALAGVDATSDDGASFWLRYATSWTAWNHVRAASAFAASALLTTFLLVS